MLVQNYTTATAFLEKAQPFLEQRESVNNLILGIAIRLREHPDWNTFPCYLATVESQPNQIELAAVMTPPKEVLLASSEEPSGEAMQALLQNLRAERWQPPGVNGPSGLVDRFAQAWTQENGRRYRVRMRERVYELREVSRLSYSPGTLRLTVENDLELVARWRTAFLKEAVEGEDLETARKVSARRIAAGDMFLWEDGEPVSMAMRSRPTPHGITVTSVYTPPEFRQRGYATSCVAALSQLLLDQGKAFCNLFTDLANPTSNAIYQKIGYRPVCDFHLIRFEAQDEQDRETD